MPYNNRQGNVKKISSEIHLYANRQPSVIPIPKGNTIFPLLFEERLYMKLKQDDNVVLKKLHPLHGGIHHFN